MLKEKKINILVVDDEADITDYLAEYLNKQGFNAYEANDGRKAIEFVKNNPCDLMLLDIKMRGVGGMEVLEETRKINPKIDVVMISSWDSEDVAREMLKKGAIDYIAKPIRLEEEVMPTIKRVLARREERFKGKEG